MKCQYLFLMFQNHVLKRISGIKHIRPQVFPIRITNSIIIISHQHSLTSHKSLIIWIGFLICTVNLSIRVNRFLNVLDRRLQCKQLLIELVELFIFVLNGIVELSNGFGVSELVLFYECLFFADYVHQGDDFIFQLFYKFRVLIG